MWFVVDVVKRGCKGINHGRLGVIPFRPWILTTTLRSDMPIRNVAFEAEARSTWLAAVHQLALEVRQVEIDNLLEERERASNELQKLKDIIGSVENPDDYRKRKSYLPDCSSQLYDTVRDLQSKIQRKLQRMHECAAISEEVISFSARLYL